MKYVAIAALCLFLSLSSAWSQPNRATTDISTTIEQFYQSLNDNDVEAASQFATDDWEHVTPSGRWLRGKNAVILDIKSTSPVMRRQLRIQDIQVRTLGAQSAVVIVTAYESSPKGLIGFAEDYQKQISTYVLIRRKARWLIAHDHSSNGHE